MADFLPPVTALLMANIKDFSAKMGEAKEEMAGVDGAGAKMGLGAKAALIGLGVAGVAIAAESVKLAMGFDQQMEMIHTQAGASQSEVDGLKDKVLSLATAVGIGPDKLAEGLYHIESAGYRGQQAMDILASASKLAVIGQTDLESSAQAVVGVMASQIKGVRDAADAGNLLNTTVGIGDMRMGQLTQAIGTGLLPKAASVGATFEDTASMLATLTDNVTPANEAATRLGMTFSLMAAPTDKAKEAYESIGMSSVQMANDIRSKGVLFALQDLKDHLNQTYPPGKAVTLTLQQQQSELAKYSASLTAAGVPVSQQTTLLATFKDKLKETGSAAVLQSDALSKMFGGGKSSGTMLTLLGEMDRLKDKTEAFGTAASRAQQMQDAWKSQQNQFSQQMKVLGATFEVAGIKLGNILIPYLQVFLGWVRDGVRWLGQHKEVLYALGITVGTIVVAGLVSATVAAWNWAAAMLAATWPVLAVIAAVAALAAGFVYAWNHVKIFRDTVKDIGKFLLGVWRDIEDFFKHWSEHWGQFTKVVSKAWDATYKAIVDAWTKVTGWLGQAWQDLTRLWNETGGKVVSIIARAWKRVSDDVSGEWRHIIGDLSSIWQNAVRLWNDTGGKLIDVIVDGAEMIYDFLSGFWDDAVDVVKGALDIILGVIHGSWDAIRGVAVIVWHLIYATIKTAWDLITSVVGIAIDAVETVLKVAWNIIVGVVHVVWDTITGIINTALDLIKDVFQLFTDFVTGHWSKLWDDVKKIAGDLWHNVYTLISGVLSNIKTTVVNSAKDIWNGFIKGIEDALTGIGKALKDVWTAIIGFFKDAGTWLFQIGKDILQGLINGVESMGDAAVGAVKKVGSDIKSGFSKVLSIFSPSREFHQFGRYIVQGLINGIGAESSGAVDMARKLALGVRNGFGTPQLALSAAASLTGAPGAGVPSSMTRGGTVTVENHLYLDGRQITAALRSQVLQYDNRNSKNGLALAGTGFS